MLVGIRWLDSIFDLMERVDKCGRWLDCMGSINESNRYVQSFVCVGRPRHVIKPVAHPLTNHGQADSWAAAANTPRMRDNVLLGLRIA